MRRIPTLAKLLLSWLTLDSLHALTLKSVVSRASQALLNTCLPKSFFSPVTKLSRNQTQQKFLQSLRKLISSQSVSLHTKCWPVTQPSASLANPAFAFIMLYYTKSRSSKKRSSSIARRTASTSSSCAWLKNKTRGLMLHSSLITLGWTMLTSNSMLIPHSSKGNLGRMPLSKPISKTVHTET